ncbi:MAG: hypothetical protein A3I66_01435 [Burkholderiales bacterium RIFCSPLOWO2_02_FULL_57_36]|nr:MAG: hypothetical protein A3I66_01435 [Burkholderiales bacterium RIFCSPLOWO2_02_FULL_57_36]
MREFNDLSSFILHFATLEVAVQKSAERALDRSLQVIEETAKAEIGHYQPAAGPFNEWAQLAESTLKHHERMGVGDSPLLVTGELYASIEHERSGGEGVVGTKLEKGKWQEFGTDKIPPRPFMGPAAYVNKENIEKIMARGVTAGLIGGNALLGHDITK